MKRTFIYATGVSEVLRENQVVDRYLRELELAIMRGKGVIVAGTGGIKKIRCGSTGKGKSGSVRVLFADYGSVGRVYILAAFSKTEKDNVSRAERNDLENAKKYLDSVIESLVKE